MFLRKVQAVWVKDVRWNGSSSCLDISIFYLFDYTANRSLLSSSVQKKFLQFPGISSSCTTWGSVAVRPSMEIRSARGIMGWGRLLSLAVPVSVAQVTMKAKKSNKQPQNKTKQTKKPTPNNNPQTLFCRSFLQLASFPTEAVTPPCAWGVVAFLCFVCFRTRQEHFLHKKTEWESCWNWWG